MTLLSSNDSLRNVNITSVWLFVNIHCLILINIINLKFKFYSKVVRTEHYVASPPRRAILQSVLTDDKLSLCLTDIMID